MKEHIVKKFLDPKVDQVRAHDLESESPELDGNNSIFREEETEVQHLDNKDTNLEGDRDLPENFVNEDLRGWDDFFDAEDIDLEETIVVNEPRYNLRDRTTL